MVLRREMRLYEGELLSRPALDLSSFKIQQLGFVRPDPDPQIEPVEGQDAARIHLKLEEQGPERSAGGGAATRGSRDSSSPARTRRATSSDAARSSRPTPSSEGAARSTSSPSASLGSWASPISSASRSTSRTRSSRQDQTQAGHGGASLLGRQIGAFTNVQAVYRYEAVDYTDNSSNLQSTQLTSSHTVIGSITPSYSYDRVDDPYRPSRGTILNVSGAGREAR